jgi:hypothetical protein
LKMRKKEKIVAHGALTRQLSKNSRIRESNKPRNQTADRPTAIS